VAEVVECLNSKHEAKCSNPSSTKRKINKEGRKEEKNGGNSMISHQVFQIFVISFFFPFLLSKGEFMEDR
jgi:hypothetical protein